MAKKLPEPQPTPKIAREDLEATFRSIKGELDQKATSAKSSAKPIAIAGGVLFVILVYLIGKRVGKKKSTIVEIRRI